MSEVETKSKARGTLTLVSEIGGVVGLAVLVVAAALSEDVRDWIEDAADWLYPDGVIALLSLTVVLLALVLWRTRRQLTSPPLTDRQFAQDRDLVEDLKTIVPRQSMHWLKEHDFGIPWTDDEIRPFNKFHYERDEVEFQFHDAELERHRREFLGALSEFLTETALRAGVDKRGRFSLSAWDNSPSPLSDEQREANKEESRKVINDASWRLVRAYDAIIQRARQLHLLDRRSWSDPS